MNCVLYEASVLTCLSRIRSVTLTQYLYSTASSPLQHLSEEDVAETPAVLAGYGYGLYPGL